MRITKTKVETRGPKPYAYLELSTSNSDQHIDMTFWNPDCMVTFFKPSPDELEVVAQALLDLAQALRTKLAAHEERKGQETKPEEVQP